jgi:hypothetical protein
MAYRVELRGRDQAVQVLGWFKTRGGVLVWPSADLASPATQFTTPLLTADGVTPDKPHWTAGSPFPVTDPAEVGVVVGQREVRRFRVSVRRGRSEFRLKLTDHSAAKLSRALSDVGRDAWFEFDYATQEAVVYVPDGPAVPLTSFQEEVANAAHQ